MAKHSNFLRDLSESYLADLGRITAGWSQIELLFDVLFLSLVVFWGRSTGSTKEPQVTKLMGMRFCDRLRALRDRINEMDLPPETQKAAEKVLSQLNTLRNERDRVAHSVWSPQITEEFAINPEAAIALYKSWKTACVARARRLDGGVEREQIGLGGHILNEAHHVANPLGRGGEALHRAPLVLDRRVEPGDDDERGLAQRRRDIAAVDRLDMARGLARLG